MPTTDETRADTAGEMVNAAQAHVRDALRLLDLAREQLQGTAITHVSRVVSDPCERSLTGRDISIAITELEGVLLRLKHGTPGRS